MTLIMHAADIHLGFRQYGSDERSKDFALAFSWLAEEAIAHKVDCLLVAGDLFHGGAFRPETLWEAARVLTRLQTCGIPVIAVEGNHDRPRHLAKLSWLDYLAQRRLLVLLDTQLKDGRLDFRPWNGQSLYGAHYPLPGNIELVGARYQGTALPKFVDTLVPYLAHLKEELPPKTFVILMMHEGVEGIIERVPGGLTPEELARLDPYVDYLALGHFHVPFILWGKVHNPGSLETYSTTEVKWTDRGYLLLNIGYLLPDMERISSVTRVPYTDRRKFTRLTWRMDNFANPKDFYYATQTCLAPANPGHPVLEIRLVGRLQFPRELLDTGDIKQRFSELYGSIVCRVRDLTERGATTIALQGDLSREETEYQVIRGLVARDVPEEQVETWTGLTQGLKGMALGKAATDRMTTEVRSFNETLKEEPCESSA